MVDTRTQEMSEAPDIQRKFDCEWVRRGAPGVTRYEGTKTVWASGLESAIERARREVARDSCFAVAEIEITKITCKAIV